VLKAAISGAASRAIQTPDLLWTPIPLRGRPNSEIISGSLSDEVGTSNQEGKPASMKPASFQCPRCTFLNHPSLLSCELCGAPLLNQDPLIGLNQERIRPESPEPVLGFSSQDLENIKLSFRGGGDKIFYERLKGAMTQRKWLLQGAPPVPKPSRMAGDTEASSSSVKTVGIAGLEQRRLEARKNNEVVIGNAFEDLEALMTSAKEIVALAESFAQQTNGSNSINSSETNALLAQSATELGLVTTKDMLGSGGNSETLYLSELSRNLAEFLTDDARGVLRRAGGIISLVDLWAMFNRARGGVELVSPMDFEKAARLWENLKLPVLLRKFKSGVLVVQASDRTDEKTIRALNNWMRDLQLFPPDKPVPWDWQIFGRGVTAKDAAEHFGWSIGVATEELAMAEEKGALCREESIEGLKYWHNYIGISVQDG
jgi:ESCRT-II complex subunit VPS36